MRGEGHHDLHANDTKQTHTRKHSCAHTPTHLLLTNADTHTLTNAFSPSHTHTHTHTHTVYYCFCMVSGPDMHQCATVWVALGDAAARPLSSVTPGHPDLNVINICGKPPTAPRHSGVRGTNNKGRFNVHTSSFIVKNHATNQEDASEWSCRACDNTNIWLSGFQENQDIFLSISTLGTCADSLPVWLWAGYVYISIYCWKI